jgi:UPF0716 protein FxsA
MVGFLVVVFVVAPLVELYGIIQVASVVGGWNTIGLLILVSIAGAWLVKREGISVLRRIQAALDEGRLPHKELVDGFLVLLAGVLLLAPGFISDILAIILLLPPLRLPVRGLLLRSMKRRGWALRVADAGAGFGGRVNRPFGNNVFDVSAQEHPPRSDPASDGPTAGRPDELGQ